ncbi:MAG: ABC transporter ATP-binding protein [Armatimonadetes bacterium]|nr:ABC transporter ATP-binding protein [Armatimonadota bacterium]
MSGKEHHQRGHANAEFPLLEKIRPNLADVLEPGEELQVAVEADMVLPGSFGVSWLVATDRRVAVFTPNGKVPHTTTEVPLSQVRALRKRELLGSVLLEAHTDDRAVPLIRFTEAKEEAIDQAAEQIRALLVDPLPEEEEDQSAPEERGRKKASHCPECGKPIPRWMSVCLDCMNQRQLILRLIKRAGPYAGPIIVSLVMAILAVTADLAQAPLQKYLIDSVIPNRSLQGLVYVMLAILGIRVFTTVVGAARQLLMSWLGEKVTYDLRGEVYSHLQRLGLRYYDQKETGWIMDRVTSDTTTLQVFMTDAMQRTVINALTLVIIAVYMFSMSPLLALLSLIPAPIVCLMSARFMKRTHTIWHWAYRRRSRLFALLSNVLPGVRVVKAFTQEGREHVRFDERSRDYMDANVNAARVFAAFNRTTGFVMALSSLAIWGYGGYLVIKGVPGNSLGLLVAFMQLVMRFYAPLQDLTGLSQQVQRAATAAQRVFEVLDTAPDMEDAPEALDLPGIWGEIEFCNVTFGYDERRPVLKNVSFHIRPGEMIGLVGPSGAGKSTTINLICRFYDVTGGAVLVDGHDVRDIKIDSLRQQIGIVLQEPFLFHGTIAENIAYGCPEATMEDIMRAAKAANAHDFILKFPEGYDAMVGERGARLSGGERQRISIARAILKNPRILILDEATSSVDSETEAQIREAIDRLVHGRTTFAIAHRLSTLQNANRLIVLEKGRVVEMGTHAELLSKEDGVFRRLVDLHRQLSEAVAVGG